MKLSIGTAFKHTGIGLIVYLERDILSIHFNHICFSITPSPIGVPLMVPVLLIYLWDFLSFTFMEMEENKGQRERDHSTKVSFNAVAAKLKPGSHT